MISPNNPFVKYKQSQQGNISDSPDLQEEIKPKKNPFYELSERNKNPERTKEKEKLPEESPKEKSFINDVLLKSVKEIPDSLSGQIGLGLSQAVTSPLDLMKMYVTAEGLSGLEEAQEASDRMGIPFDMEAERKKFLGAMESMPTQQLAEEWLKQETGIDTQPKGRFQKVMRGIAELAGLSPKGQKIPKLEPKKLGAEGQALRETAEEFGLRKFAGMEAEKPPGINPVVSTEKQAKLATELGETSKKAIEDIIEQKIPVKKMRDMGIDLENAYDVSYSAARKTAAEMGDKPIDFSNVLQWIDKEIGKTKGSSPSLSTPQKKYIGILESEKKNLTKAEPKSSSVTAGEVKEVQPNPSINFLTGEHLKPTKEMISSKVKVGGGHSIDLITGKKLPPSTKNMNANQALNQYKNFNANLKGIYRKPEFAGSESSVVNAYTGLNKQIIEAIEKANPVLANELKFANKVFHEGSKLEQVEGIMKKSFSEGYNPKKLDKTLSNKRERKFLERSLGKDSIQDLERIAKYGQEAEKKVFNNLKNPKTIKEYLNNMTPMQLGLLVGGKAHIGAPYYMAKGTLNRIQGLIFTRNSTKKDYIQFLKDSSKLGAAPTSKIIIDSARNLQKSIEKEFGSEEDLIKMSENKE